MNNTIAVAIRQFVTAYPGTKSRYIWADSNIPADVLEQHKAVYFYPEGNEKALIVLNRKFWHQFLGWGFSGITITDKAVHFCAIKNTIFASIIQIRKKGVIDWSRIKSIEFAEADAALGTAYVGHELKINGAIVGFVRMGGGLTMDDNALSYLNSLFGFLASENVIEQAPNEYTWQ